MAADTILTPGSDQPSSAELTANRNVSGERVVLGNLPNAKRLTGAQAEQRSRTVRRLRVILPLIALLLVVMFLVMSQSSQEEDAFLSDLAIEDVADREALVIKPKFSGNDNANNPYQITAATAAQNPDTTNLISLEGPRAILNDKTAETVATAKRGEFNSDDKILQLEEDVTLERVINGRTYVLNSEKASVSIEDQMLISKSGVSGKTINGRLRADQIEIDNADGRVKLSGNVRMKFEPKTLNEIGTVPPTADDNE